MNCKHERKQFCKVYYKTLEGVEYHKLCQCLSCGQAVKFKNNNMWPTIKGEIIESLPDFDIDLMQRKELDPKIQERAIEKLGTRKQLLKVAEECNELATELIRYANNEGGEGNIKNEAADVYICLEYVKIVFGSFESEIQEKLERLERLL